MSARVRDLRRALERRNGPGLRDAPMRLDLWAACPLCGDPEDGTKPLALHDDGRLSCRACHAEHDALAAALGDDETPADVFPLLTVDDLLDAPAAAWLIDEVIPEGLAVLHGPPGSFKSFLALDWALSVAAGAPWLGHDVRGSWVVYVAAEGRGGIGQRVAAWIDRHPAADLSRFRLLADTVNLLDADATARVERTLGGLPARPGLLVVDTLARSMPGGDENHARDVGALVAAVDQLRGDRSALVVHHDRKDGGGERGSGALRGAADLMVGLERKTGEKVIARCEKLKEAEEWDPLHLVAAPAAGSLVLDLDETESSGDAWRPTALMERVSRYLETCPDPVSKSGVVREVGGKAQYTRTALDLLVEDGYVERLDDPARRGTSLHTSIVAYREASEQSHPVPPSHPVPTPSGRAPRPPVPPRPPLTRGRVDGTGMAPETTPSLVPATEVVA